MGRYKHRPKSGGDGGGGGGGGGSETNEGEDNQTKLDGENGGQKRNVFISFHAEDEAQVNLLRSQAKKDDQNLEFRDYSIKEPFDEKWKTQAKDRISQTSATIVMIGPGTSNRDAVNWEIEESYRQKKKVIGVRIYRDRNDPVPQDLKDHKAPVVDWDLTKIQQHLDKS